MRMTSAFGLVTAASFMAFALVASAAAQTTSTLTTTQAGPPPARPKGLWDPSQGFPAPPPRKITPDPKWTPATAQEHGHIVKFTPPAQLPPMPMPPGAAPATAPAKTTASS